MEFEEVGGRGHRPMPFGTSTGYRVARVSRAQEPGEVDPTQDRAGLGREEHITPTPNGKAGRPPWA
ncbi:MAG: hypothetical protein M3495_17945 [Pseudomonadota bacterium]|nr:hypothetical protein [Pseudomonadota bacterium]